MQGETKTSTAQLVGTESLLLQFLHQKVSRKDSVSSPGNGHSGDGDDKDTCQLRNKAVESEITGEAAKELSG